MEIWLPRNLRMTLGGALMISWPRKRAEPLTLAFAALRPRRFRKVWLFPDPLSPTMPTHSPGLMAKLNPSMAVTSPRGLPKRTVRSFTSSRAVMFMSPLAVAGVKRIAQTVTDEIETEHGDRQ